MKWIVQPILLSAVAASCNSDSHSINRNASTVEVDSIKTIHSAAEFTYQIIDADKSTFGYQILQSNKLLVNQPHIPGLSAVSGFKSKEDAIKVPEFVIEKIKKQMPPTVTIEGSHISSRHLSIAIVLNNKGHIGTGVAGNYLNDLWSMTQ